MNRLRLIVMTVAALALTACSEPSKDRYAPEFGPASGSGVPEYVVAPLPVYNPKRLFEIYAPLIDRLNERIPNAHFRFQASRSFADFEKNLNARRFDFALPNPYETVNALRYGYHVFAKMGNDETFRGVILVRKDSHIREIPDLAGKTVSFPAPTALAAALMPQLFLHTHGIDVNRDIKVLYSGSHESTIMNVYLDNASAGAVWLPTWQAFAREHPGIAAKLEVRWQTGTLPNNGVVARDDLPPGVIKQVAAVLFSLHQSEAGRAILAGIGTSGFEAANDERYQPVRRFVREFAQRVRPIELAP